LKSLLGDFTAENVVGVNKLTIAAVVIPIFGYHFCGQVPRNPEPNFGSGGKAYLSKKFNRCLSGIESHGSYA
jgi:hypothetical protein